jgi:hypothetical protein
MSLGILISEEAGEVFVGFVNYEDAERDRGRGGREHTLALIGVPSAALNASGQFSGEYLDQLVSQVFEEGRKYEREHVRS